MADWHLYIIRCKNGTLYTGVTLDVARRFEEHRAQGRKCARYLRGRAPLELAFRQLVGEKSAAFRAEQLVKRLPKSKKEALLRGSLQLNDLAVIEHG